MVERLVRWALRRPVWVVAGSVVVTAALLVPALRLRRDDSLRIWLAKGGRAARNYDRFVQTFGGDDILLAAFDFPPQDREAALTLATEAAQAVGAVAGVRSVTDTGNLVHLLGPSHPALLGHLITPDGRTLALACTLEARAARSETEVLGDVRAALDRTLGRHGPYFLAGPAVVSEALRELGRQGAVRILPWVVLLCGAVLVVAVRQVVPVALSLAVVGASLVVPLGVLSLAGGTMNLLVGVMPSLLFVVCLSYCLHLVVTYRHLQVPGAEDAGAVAAAARAVASRCWMCSLTTAAGFGSLTLTRLAPVRVFGLLTALGVVVGFVVCCLVLPAALILANRIIGRRPADAWAPDGGSVPVPSPLPVSCDLPTGGGWGGWAALAAWAGRRRWGVLVGGLLVTGLGGAAALRLRPGAAPLEYLPESNRLVRDWRAVEARFGSPSPLTVEVTIDPALGLHPVAALHILEVIQQYLNHYEPIKATQSLVDWPPLWEFGGSFSDLPPVLADVAPRLRTADGSRFAIWARYDIARRDIDERLQGDLDRFVAETFGHGVTVTVTGVLALVQASERELMRVLLVSLVAAAAVILAMLLLVVRSAHALAAAVLPTVAPVVVTLGVMGLVGARADPGTVTVAAVALGLAVDHTIHILCAYRGYRLARRADPLGASLRECGGAILLTSLASAAGFALFALSPFRPVMHFGMFLGLAMLLSLGAAVVILPALVRLAWRGGGEDDSPPRTQRAPRRGSEVTRASSP